MVDGKGLHFDVVAEWLEAAYAFQFDRLDKGAGDPKRAFGDPEVQRVPERPGALDLFRGQLRDRTFLFAFEMQAVGLDLPEMDFHLEMKNDE
jgi:hypothetical protein